MDLKEYSASKLLVGSKADKANKGFAFYQSKFRRKKHVKNLNPGKNYC